MIKGILIVISFIWIFCSCSFGQKKKLVKNDKLNNTEWILVSIDSSGTSFTFNKPPFVKFKYDKIIRSKKEGLLIRGQILIGDDPEKPQYYYRIKRAFYFLKANNIDQIETWWEDYRLTDKYETVLRTDNPRLYEVLYYSLNGKGIYEINEKELKITINESKNKQTKYILNFIKYK